MSGQTGISSCGLEGLLKRGSVNANPTVEDLTLRAAHSTGRLGVGVPACDALTIRRIPRAAGGTDVRALARSVEELLSSAALEEDALTVLQTVVSSEAADAETGVLVNSRAVVGDSQAVTVDRPLVACADGLLGAAASEVLEVPLVAFIALSADEVEGLAVDLHSHAGAEAELFPGLAAGEGGGYLHALAVPDDLAGDVTGEAVSGEGVEVVAKGRDINTEKTESRWDLSGRAGDLLADTVFNKETKDAARAPLESSVELDALHGNGDALQTVSVLSVRAVDNDGCAGTVSVQLEEIANTGKTFSSIGVESSARGRDVEAGEIGDPLVGSTGDLLRGASSISEDVVGILAGEAVTSEGVEGIALHIDIDALSVAEVFSRRTLSVGQASAVLKSVSGDTGRASFTDGVEAGTGESARGGSSSTSLEISIKISKVRIVGAGIGISLECSPAHESVLVDSGVLEVLNHVVSRVEEELIVGDTAPKGHVSIASRRRLLLN